MDVRAAADLIQGAVPQGSATWADLGAGSGTFTLALATILGDKGRVIAVDRDAAALEALRVALEQASLGTDLAILHADFRNDLDLPPLDGVLLANALHFVPTEEQSDVLARVIGRLRPNGRLLVVDYDRRGASTWVPYPVSSRRLREMFAKIGLSAPTVVGTRPSQYGGTIYAAYTVVNQQGR